MKKAKPTNKRIANWFQRRITYPARNLTPYIDDFFADAETVHLEQMNRNGYWLGIYGKNGKRICLWITAQKGLNVFIWENNLAIRDEDYGEVITGMPRQPKRGDRRMD